MNKGTKVGRSEKSAKGYISKDFFDQRVYEKGRSFYAKNRPKGTSARRFSARGYMTKDTQVERNEKSAKGYINKKFFDQRVHQ